MKRLMKKLLVGDLHGNFSLIPHVRKVHADYDEIIIVGDFGLGFHRDDEARVLARENVKPLIRFIRGNHDNLEVCKEFTSGSIQWIPDGTLEGNTLYVGGAWSIDHQMRTPGLNWWYNEELNEQEWEDIFRSLEGKFEQVETVISHDAPARVSHLVLAAHKPIIRTRTSLYLDLLMNRLPNVRTWVFGHYHVYHNFEYNGVNFICLPDKVGRTHTLYEKVS
jgi:predicted phosphodiesterase